MDFRDKPEEAAFREEVKEFILAEAPVGQLDFREAWQRGQTWWKKLQDRGWIAPAWPKEYGGGRMTVKRGAVRDGDDYVINGQKTWTTLAHQAKWMIMLARTDPDAPKHKGITYFMVDMKSPGLTGRPLVNMAGGPE